MHIPAPTPTLLLSLALSQWLSSLPVALALTFNLPHPKGDYAVAHETAHLVDYTRSIPYDASHGPRDVMISLFYPVPRAQCARMCAVEYMPPVTAAYVDAYAAANYGVPVGTMMGLGMEVCCAVRETHGKHTGDKKDGKKEKEHGVPVVLFQPGLTNSRLQYNYLAMNLASAGYAVVTMDHAHETLVSEFPDGKITLAVPESHWDYEHFPNVPVMNEQMGIRIADAEFVLAQLRRPDVVARLLPHLGGVHLDTKRVAMFGHSFGGAASVAALTKKGTPFAGGVQMDGWQPPVNGTTAKPALLFGRADHYNGDDSWLDLWAKLRGWKKELRLAESMHNTFGGDLALLFKLRGVPVTATTLKATGALDGERSFGVVGAYVRAFMDKVLKGEEGGLLDGESAGYPEVEFLR